MPDNRDEKLSTEVEPEDLGESKITEPYDPDLIKIENHTVNLGTIIEQLEYNEIDLLPDFQRSANLWTHSQKCKLIESLLLGLPLPTFFFAETRKIVNGKSEKIWMVVDGLQRLSTIKSFVQSAEALEKDNMEKLQLSGLEFLKGHEDKYYEDLSREEIRKIKGARITYSLINEDNPKLVKYLVFRRINTGGLTLTEQEIRHALNQGKAAGILQRLASEDSFLKVTANSIKSDRMLDREFVNRFLAFYILGYDAYDGDMDIFLSKVLESISGFDSEKIRNIEAGFIEGMKRVYSIFDNNAFRKNRQTASRRSPISKALFDTVSYNLAIVSQKDGEKLISEKELFKEKFFKLIEADKDFFVSISNATGSTAHVKTRFKKIKKLIEDVL